MSRTPSIDPAPRGRVSPIVGPLLRTILVSAMAALAVPACGPKNSGKTTPSGGGGDTKGMDGAGPVGDGKDGGGGGAGGGDSGDTGGGDTGDTGGDTGGDDAVVSGPKVEPPMLDISEDEKKSRVNGSLARARDALEEQHRDPNLAIKEAKDALSVDPNSVDAVVVLAHAYYFRKLYDTSQVLLDRVVNSNVTVVKEKAAKHADLYYVYGLVFDKTGEPARATFAYEKARSIEPNHKNALMNLGVHYLADSRYAEARDIYEKLTKQLGVQTPAAWTNLGSAYRGLSASGTIDAGARDSLLRDAETSYKRAIDANKNYAAAYYDLGLLYMDAKPFPLGNGPMDELVRFDRAATYFKDYKTMPGADLKLADERLLQVDKARKKEEKARKKKEKEAADKAKGDDW